MSGLQNFGACPLYIMYIVGPKHLNSLATSFACNYENNQLKSLDNSIYSCMQFWNHFSYCCPHVFVESNDKNVIAKKTCKIQQANVKFSFGIGSAVCKPWNKKVWPYYNISAMLVQCSTKCLNESLPDHFYLGTNHFHVFQFCLNQSICTTIVYYSINVTMVRIKRSECEKETCMHSI